uniref:Delta-like protein n=1 Tax=Romanomermis culicivorax TaxID=13658 RepID=A0A915JPV0_ROMCU
METGKKPLFLFRPLCENGPITVGSMKLFIQVNHRDISTGIEYLMINSSRSVLAPAVPTDSRTRTVNWHKAKAIHRFPMIDEQISLEYGYRVRCDPGYFGDKCGQSCVPRNNETGHFTCDEQGHRKCLPGWSNVDLMCTKPVCKKDCKGTCQRPGECDNCPFGWHGANCDKCIKFPDCVHGYCIKPFECRCHEKWGGLKCDLDLDYCYHNTPCKNGAECIPHAINNYTCECKPGYTELNPCWNNPCENFGTCMVVSSHSYQCLCDKSHYGPRCEFSTSGKGDSDPCFYHGDIYGHGDTWETDDCRKCKCTDGFYNCSEKIGQCLPADVVEHEFGRVNLKFCRNGTAASTSTAAANDDNEVAGKMMQELKFCDKFFLKLDADLLPEGTYPEHICHAVYVLLLKENMMHYNLFCRMIQKEPFVRLEIDIVSISEKWTVNGLKPYLIEELKAKYQSKPLLNAISAVYDESLSGSLARNEQLVQEQNQQKEDSWNIAALVEGRWILIYSLPLLAIPIVVLFFILINIIRKQGLLAAGSSPKITCSSLDTSDYCSSSKINGSILYEKNNLSKNSRHGGSCSSIVYSPILTNLKMCNLFKNQQQQQQIYGEKLNVSFRPINQQHQQWSKNSDDDNYTKIPIAIVDNCGSILTLDANDEISESMPKSN